MSCGIGKRTWEPLQISINRGPQPKERGNLEIQIFFKTSSSSKEALLKVLKPPSSTLEVYKQRSSVGSSLNAPLEFFNNTLNTNQRYSSKHLITRGIPGDTNFLQDKLCKQGSSRSLSLQARKLSQRVLKPLLSTLESTKNEALLDQV